MGNVLPTGGQTDATGTRCTLDAGVLQRAKGRRTVAVAVVEHERRLGFLVEVTRGLSPPADKPHRLPIAFLDVFQPCGIGELTPGYCSYSIESEHIRDPNTSCVSSTHAGTPIATIVCWVALKGSLESYRDTGEQAGANACWRWTGRCVEHGGRDFEHRGHVPHEAFHAWCLGPAVAIHENP